MRVRATPVALAVLSVAAACVPPPPGGGRSRPTAALVFLWHTQGRPHEPGSVTPNPPWGAGWYDSRDPQVAEYHLDLMKDNDVNLMLLSWWGTGTSSFARHIDSAADSYVSEAEEHRMRWAVFWEAVNPDGFEADLARIAAWTGSVWYYHRDGKPVLFVYKRVWSTLSQAQLEALAADYALFLDKYPKPADLPAGVGWSYWDVAFTAEADLIDKYETVAAEDVPFMAFVASGLDNSGFADPPTVWPEGGPSPEWLHYQAELAERYDPDIVAVPFNELGEHSAVEPTVELGTTITEAWGDVNVELRWR